MVFQKLIMKILEIKNSYEFKSRLGIVKDEIHKLKARAIKDIQT